MNSENSIIKQNIWDDIISLAVILDINLEVKERNWKYSAALRSFKELSDWNLYTWMMEALYTATFTPRWLNNSWYECFVLVYWRKKLKIWKLMWECGWCSTECLAHGSSNHRHWAHFSEVSCFCHHQCSEDFSYKALGNKLESDSKRCSKVEDVRKVTQNF